MKNKYTKPEINVLNTFLKIHIPDSTKWNTIEKWDLMECYEEMFNYIGCIIDGHQVDLNKNSYGTDNSFIFKKEYEEVLINIAKNDDCELRVYCYLTLASLTILKKYKQ